MQGSPVALPSPPHPRPPYSSPPPHYNLRLTCNPQPLYCSTDFFLPFPFFCFLFCIPPFVIFVFNLSSLSWRMCVCLCLRSLFFFTCWGERYYFARVIAFGEALSLSVQAYHNSLCPVILLSTLSCLHLSYLVFFVDFRFHVSQLILFITDLSLLRNVLRISMSSVVILQIFFIVSFGIPELLFFVIIVSYFRLIIVVCIIIFMMDVEILTSVLLVFLLL